MIIIILRSLFLLLLISYFLLLLICDYHYIKIIILITITQGEVLFVPAGCPHGVRNVTDTVAISANYIDSSNL